MTAPSHSLPSKLASAAPQPGDDADADLECYRAKLIEADGRFRDAMARAASGSPSPPSAIQRRV